MKRRYEKVIEQCLDCPDYELHDWCDEGYAHRYGCNRRSLLTPFIPNQLQNEYYMKQIRGISDDEASKILTEWFATCDLPEVKAEEKVRG